MCLVCSGHNCDTSNISSTFLKLSCFLLWICHHSCDIFMRAKKCFLRSSPNYFVPMWMFYQIWCHYAIDLWPPLKSVSSLSLLLSAASPAAEGGGQRWLVGLCLFHIHMLISIYIYNNLQYLSQVTSSLQYWTLSSHIAIFPHIL